MKEVKCPNCNLILNVRDSAHDVICNKCLEITGKMFIMLESPDVSNKTRYLGDGLYERIDE